MLSTLVSSTATDAATANKRMVDIVKLLSGEITTVAGLSQTAWDISVCKVTATEVSPFSRIYSSRDLSTVGSTVDWQVHLKKASSVAGKDITFRFGWYSGTYMQLFAGNHLADGTVTNETSLVYIPEGPATAANRYIVGTSTSGLFIHGYSTLMFGVERTNYPYDKSSSENLGVVGSIGGFSGTIYVSKIYNPKLQNYTAYSPTTKIADPGAVAVTRDANAATALPFIPMYIESYENGWAGGNLSTNSNIYRTADNMGKTWDSTVQGGKTWRILQIGATVLRYVVLEE
jgi:hypothetical protein